MLDIAEVLPNGIDALDTASLERKFVNPLTEVAAQYASASRGVGTRRAYDSAWRSFTAWCQDQDADPFSGEATIALHISDMARQGCAVSTVDVRLAAIRHEYRKADMPLNMQDSVLAPVREGITRTVGCAPRRKATPITPAELRPMLASRRHATDAQGARDRALLLIGFGAALRRSELVALTIGDVVEVKGKGLLVTVRRSKTDQGGEGAEIAVSANRSDPALCPLIACRQWMTHRSVAKDMVGDNLAARPLLCSVDKSGALSGEALNDKTVDRVIKAAAEAAGFVGESFSGHSLRRGLMTAGAAAGVDLAVLMRQSRHKDVREALGYIDAAERWNHNASSAVFAAA